MFSPARFHSKIKPAGRTAPFACPTCGQTVQMQVFHNFELLKILEIPVHSFNCRYFAVCPQCASVFEPMDGCAADGFEQIAAADLIPLKQTAPAAPHGEAL